jgi:CheY-like chemotaxis protein
MHGGTVKAHSEGIGQGSVFTVRLPLTRSESHEASASAQPPAAPDRDRGRKRRVMVVDDNTDAVHGLVMLLELAGHEVRAAYDGNQALDIATSFQPDAVLLDIGLPGLSGCDVAKWIRRQCWGGEVLLIAVTGWGQPEDQRRTAAAGFDHHLTKPVSPETVERLLAIEGHCAG